MCTGSVPVKGGVVAFDVYDGRGKRIGSAVQERLAAGSYKVKWTDAAGGARPLPGGVYLLVWRSQKIKAALKAAYTAGEVLRPAPALRDELYFMKARYRTRNSGYGSPGPASPYLSVEPA